jgi:hypothetical protein
MDVMTSMDIDFVQAFSNLVILWPPLKIVESLLGQPTWKDIVCAGDGSMDGARA